MGWNRGQPKVPIRAKPSGTVARSVTEISDQVNPSQATHFEAARFYKQSFGDFKHGIYQ